MSMARAAARAEAKRRLPEYVKSLGLKKGVCPLCGGGHNTPCFSLDPKKSGEVFKCFSCGASGDVFDLFAAVNHMPTATPADMGEVMEAVYDHFGIAFREGAMSEHTHEHTHTHTHTAEADMEKAQEARAAARDYILQAQKHLADPVALAYLASRGISQETAERYGLGYDEKGRRLVIPSGEVNYNARAVDKVDKGNRYLKPKGVVTEALFNQAALSEGGSAPLFIVEGELDALSVIEGGGSALALGSVSNVNLLLRAVEGIKAEGREVPRLIVALDADEPGQKAAEDLRTRLERLGVNVQAADTARLYNGAKDANAALVADRQGFIARLSETADRLKAQAQADYRAKMCAADYVQQFVADINTPRSAISTGFSRLDMLLSGDAASNDRGGLCEGLYIVGAVSSAGKTTFLNQVTDKIAQGGQDVLFVSLEMSKAELMAKSISRITYAIGQSRDEEANAKTAYGILRGGRYANYTIDEKMLIAEAIKCYREQIAPHVFIMQGAIQGTGVEEVTAAIERHRSVTGAAPVVVVDYLQMLAAPDDLTRGTDKQVTDFNVRALKVASRDFHTPIIAVSSYNRESYITESSLSAFKESGSIEYSADVVLALSYAIKAADKDNDTKRLFKAEGEKDTRNIVAEILKNRNGRKGSVFFEFMALFGYFAELSEEAQEREKRRLGL